MSTPEKRLNQVIERLDATRQTLMLGDAEWCDAETMDKCVTEVIALVERLQAENEQLKLDKIKAQMLCTGKCWKIIEDTEQ